MARYPTFEEYQKTGKYQDGLKRTNDLLKKNPRDVQLLALKIRFLSATDSDVQPVLDQLLAIRPPIQDLRELVEIEDNVVDSQRNEFPPPTSAGPVVAKLWDNALKASAAINYKLDLLSLRFSRAIANSRLADAQQALIQLKALQPKNRTFYMAHAAVTQLLSTSKEDIQARLALSLARKAVKERFDEERGVDCRVPGQIFAAHEAAEDLEGIADRAAFKESKQAYEALRRRKDDRSNGAPSGEKVNASTSASASDATLAEVSDGKERFAELIKAAAVLEDVLSCTSDFIRLFHKATRSAADDRRRVKADACFLSISGLVRAYEQSTDQAYLLNAAYLAQTLLKQNEHVHEARLILVYLYMRLGLGSLALTVFDSLRVKEIQNDTVGHALYTRISLTHPFGTGPTKKDTIEPSKRAAQALQVYIKCEDKLAETEAGALTHGQTGMIFDLEELRRSLRSSVSRRIILLEQRRVERLIEDGIGRDVAELGPRVTANWIAVTDNRDFAATFDFGYNVEKVLYGAPVGALGREWILNTLAVDAAWCLACRKEAPVKDLEKLVEEIEQTQMDMQSLQISDHQQGTKSGSMLTAESLVGRVACQLLKMLMNLKTTQEILADDVPKMRDAIAELGIKALIDAEATLTDGLLDHYAYIDILRVVEKACRLESGNGLLSGLRDEMQKAFYNVQSHAKKQMEKIKAADVKVLMKKDGRISEAVALLGTESLDFFCESIAISAREGWEGVSKIKLA